MICRQAIKIDKNQWRYGRNLINYYLSGKQYDEALQIAKEYQNQFKGNYVLDMLYAKTLLLNKKYNEANNVLNTMQILPNEGATGGRQLYKETQLMLALEEIKKRATTKLCNMYQQQDYGLKNLELVNHIIRI
ncbi:MAG: hypothetical protein WKG06_31750 [Segetibacter sp.]